MTKVGVRKSPDPGHAKAPYLAYAHVGGTDIYRYGVTEEEAVSRVQNALVGVSADTRVPQSYKAMLAALAQVSALEGSVYELTGLTPSQRARLRRAAKKAIRVAQLAAADVLELAGELQ